MAYDASKDQNASYARTPHAPARKAAAVTPHDTNNLADYCSALFIGVAGDVALIPVGSADETPVVFKNCAAGSILPVQARLVRATATTATNIVALY